MLFAARAQAMAAEHAVGVVRGVCVLASWPQTEVLRSCLLWARNLLQYGLLLSIDRRSPVAHQYDTVYDYVKGAVIHDDDPEDIRLFFWLERLDIRSEERHVGKEGRS